MKMAFGGELQIGAEAMAGVRRSLLGFGRGRRKINESQQVKKISKICGLAKTLLATQGLGP